jgi:hypothetical protein
MKYTYDGELCPFEDDARRGAAFCAKLVTIRSEGAEQ